VTTIRELLDLGFPKYAIKVLMEHKCRVDQYPLCCVETNEEGYWTCSFLKRFYPEKIFKAKCFECQIYMIQKIFHKRNKFDQSGMET